MRVVVFGATGGTGRAVVERARSAGHAVTAFARRADRIAPADGLSVIPGDVMNGAQVAPALAGQDAVVISLGNSQNPFALLFGGSRTTPRDVCEVGTRNILSALPKDRDIPIIVIGAFGTGETARNLPVLFKLFYRLVLREQMADKERQNALLKGSFARYTMIQPLALTDKPAVGAWTASRDGSFGKTEVTRADLATFIVQQLQDRGGHGETITFSG